MPKGDPGAGVLIAVGDGGGPSSGEPEETADAGEEKSAIYQRPPLLIDLPTGAFLPNGLPFGFATSVPSQACDACPRCAPAGPFV